MQNLDEKWFIKDPAGSVSGPLTLQELRSRADNGSVSADSSVSRDRKTWTSVVLVPELKLDCLVLSVEDGFNVLGPFPRKYLDNPDVMAGIPEKGVFFVRDDSFAALRRLREAETRVAAAEKAKASAEAAGAEAARKLAESEAARTEVAKRLAAAENSLTAAERKAAELDAERAADAERAGEELKKSAAAAAEAERRAETAEAELARMRDALKTLAGVNAAPSAIPPQIEIVEPEIVVNEPKPARPSVHTGRAMSGAAALEAQLQKEISMMAGKSGKFPGARK